MRWDFEFSEEGIRQQPVAELLPKILVLFRPHRKYLYTSMAMLVVITASQLAGPLVLRHIIDVSIANRDVADLLIWAGAYIAFTAAGSAVGYLQAIALFRLGINIVSDLKARLFGHVLRLGLDFHETHPPGKLISRVESDTETLKELFSDVAVNLARNLMLFVGIIAVLSIKYLSIAIWIMPLIPLFFVGTFAFMRFMKKYWREFRARWAIVTGYVNEYVQGVEVIRQFNYQGRAKKRMHEVNEAKYQIETVSMFLDNSFWGVFMLGEIMAIIIVLLVGMRAPDALSIGVIVLFFEYIRRLFEPIMQLSEQLNFIQRSMISVERIFSILETPQTVTDGPAPASELVFNHEIRFENVWFAYEEEKWILRDVSFTIPKGQRIALVGASGGGKSTIVNMLLRFYDPQRGRITVDGRDIREFPVDAWRRLLGLVLQDIFLFPGSVADNLRVFDAAISQQRVEEAAAVSRADAVIERLAGGYEGELAERGSNLSVGERQLISFARALAFDPPLLVLDEATSSVDPYTERLVQEALDRLLTGRTAVIVAHRLSTILHADCIIVIQGGEIVQMGRHAELLRQGGLYAKLYQLQFGEPRVPVAIGEGAA
jgi:ATP-binding cassette subfamily B multidrug efflux pump